MRWLPLLQLVSTLLVRPDLALADALTGKPWIVDGDTIEIAGTRIGLAGIDAPDATQPCPRADGPRPRCGELATFALAEIIEHHWITCRDAPPAAVDAAGRRLMTCHAGPYDIAAQMVRRGWARARSEAYAREEQEARAQGAGMWRDLTPPPSKGRDPTKNTPPKRL